MLLAISLLHSWYLFIFFRYAYLKCFENRYTQLHIIKYIHSAKPVHFYLLFFTAQSTIVSSIEKFDEGDSFATFLFYF